MSYVRRFVSTVMLLSIFGIAAWSIGCAPEAAETPKGGEPPAGSGTETPKTP
jgi:hypothetical protein